MNYRSLYFVFALRDTLPNQLHDTLELFDGTHDPTLDELQLRNYGGLEILHQLFITVYALDGMLGLRMVAQQIRFADEGVEQGGEVLGKPRSCREEVCDGLIKRLRVLQELLGSGLESTESPRIIIELRIGRLYMPKWYRSK